MVQCEEQYEFLCGLQPAIFSDVCYDISSDAKHVYV